VVVAAVVEAEVGVAEPSGAAEQAAAAGELPAVVESTLALAGEA